MEEKPQEEAILLVYDHDKTLSKLHTEGRFYQRSYEIPYAANLRTSQCLKQHLALIRNSEKPKVVLAVATFNSFEERIKLSWEYLGFDEGSILIRAELVPRELARTQGKNEHIVRLILDHYERNPQIKIVRVILVDDDYNNILALDSFRDFVEQSEWSEDQRLNVPVEGILAPVPEMERILVPTKSGISRSVVQMHYDKTLKVNVSTESAESEWRFLRVLKIIEDKIGLKQKTSSRNKENEFQPPSGIQKNKFRNPMTSSLDERGFLRRSPALMFERSILKSSVDSVGRVSSDCSDAERVTENQRSKLFCSSPK